MYSFALLVCKANRKIGVNRLAEELDVSESVIKRWALGDAPRQAVREYAEKKIREILDSEENTFPYRGRLKRDISGVGLNGDVFPLRKLECVNGWIWEDPDGWTFNVDEIEIEEPETKIVPPKK